MIAIQKPRLLDHYSVTAVVGGRSYTVEAITAGPEAWRVTARTPQQRKRRAKNKAARRARKAGRK